MKAQAITIRRPPYSEKSQAVLEVLGGACDKFNAPMIRGVTWTIDAPLRKTARGIDVMRSRGLLAGEMEAAALYAFA
ncbi:hypothetical protein [Sphingomonas sp. BE137]|uniref:phosphorylase family protein n=1 Tax=Sphingomonas sp. BE137 TaxID=2817844 RepID=UPI00386F1882